MKKVIKIEGMMCEHCGAHGKKALEALPGVEAAVDLQSGTATVQAAALPADEQLRAAVEQAGYQVVGLS